MRRRQFKRVFAIMLSLLTASTMIPTNAVAAESNESTELVQAQKQTQLDTEVLADNSDLSEQIKSFQDTLDEIGLNTVEEQDTIAATQPEVLTIDGVNAFETSSGEGWTYDADTKTLTLDGYNGGPIVAQCNLTIVLTEGSENKITTTEKTGTALGNGNHSGSNYTLDIKGMGTYSEEADTRPTLIVTGGEHAIHAVGSITIDNCILTAENQATQIAARYMECISSQDNLTINNSKINVKSNGVGITCYNNHIITNSDITVFANVIGIHTNNKCLEINSSKLDVTGGSGALYSSLGAVLLDNCEGTLKATVAGIYGENRSAQSTCNIKNSNLKIDADTGVMSYSDTIVENSEINFENASTGIFSHTADASKYSANTKISGNSTLNSVWTSTTGDDNNSIIIRTVGDYVCEPGSIVNGRILEKNNSILLFSGTSSISSDFTLGNARPVEILQGAEVLVKEGVTFNLVKVPNFTINGKLENNGTVSVNGDKTTNNGTIQNNSVFTEEQGILTNNGTIYSNCQATFTGEVSGTPVTLIHNDLHAVEAVDATCVETGNKAYYICNNCERYFEDEDATNEITDKDSVIISALGHDWDETNWQQDEENHWKKCNRCSETKELDKHNFKWVIDKEAVGTEKGSRHEECEICKYRGREEEIPAELTDINDLTIEMSTAKYTYSGTEKKPSVKIKNGETTLKKDVDYTITYTDNINAGMGKIHIQGIGKYTGTKTEEFLIRKKSIENFTLNLSRTDYNYTGDAKKPAATVLNGDKELEKFVDYKVIYKDNIEPGIGTVTVKGAENYKGTITAEIYIAPAKPSLSKFDKLSNGLGLNWSKVDFATGYEIYRSENGRIYTKVKTISSGDIVQWSDTTAITNGGRYSYKIIAYTKVGDTIIRSKESAVKTTYRLDTPTINTLVSQNANQATVNWTKNTKATYYHVEYSTNSDFSNSRILRVTGANNVSKTIYKLTLDQKYYVRVRSYITINGTDYSSAWSTAKSVTIEE